MTSSTTTTPATTTTTTVKPNTPLSDTQQSITQIERSLVTGESRFITRVLRNISLIRKQLSIEILHSIISHYYPHDHELVKLLFSGLTLDIDMSKTYSTLSPEVDLYLSLIALIWLFDVKNYKKGLTLATTCVEKIASLNRRTLDPIAAKIYFYFARFHSLAGDLSEMRPFLLNVERKATLRQDSHTLATILNILLSSYVESNLYDQADKLLSKTTFPEGADNNQLARYMYYQGRIKAIQLEYTDSHHFLIQAIRKVPQNQVTVGFQQTVNKWAIIVQLLMGEIPERSIFRQPLLKSSLAPYLHITQAVRVGDVAKFQETLSKYELDFQKDRLYTLILRLRHNVIKTGIRMMSLSYSRISLRDVCLKLLLDSEEDAEYIVAKSIHDGVIDAVIDHENGHVRSKENPDIYSTNEPQTAFDQRIQFCLQLYNESVKAMRFPGDAHRKDLASVQAMYEEERKLAKEILEEEGDEDEDMGF